MNLNETELRIGRLPQDIEATLCLIREDIIASKEMFDLQKQGLAEDEMFPRNRARERKIVLCCFDAGEIDDVLLFWYIKQVDKYAASVEDDHHAYTYAAFNVYVDLRMMNLIRKQERADKKADSVKTGKREPVNYRDMAKRFHKRT